MLCRCAQARRRERSSRAGAGPPARVPVTGGASDGRPARGAPLTVVASGTALTRTLAVAKAIGGLRQGGIALTPLQEAVLDLGVEQVLSPALTHVTGSFVRVMLEQGSGPQRLSDLKQAHAGPEIRDFEEQLRRRLGPGAGR